MSIAKVTEIISASEESFEDAVKKGVKRAAETIDGITGAWIESQKVTVKDGEIQEYRVNMRITFVLNS